MHFIVKPIVTTKQQTTTITGIDSKRNANPSENKNYETLNGNKRKNRVKKIKNESVTEKSITLDLAIQVSVIRTHTTRG